MHKQEYSKAMEVFQKALAAWPIYTLGHYRLGALLALKGRSSEAKKAFETALNLAKRDQDMLMEEASRAALEELSP